MPIPADRRFRFTGSLPELSWYLERRADRELYERLRAGDYCHVLAPRQMGKTSLRARTVRMLAAEGIRCASIDLTSVGSPATPEEWYFSLIDEIAKRLSLPDPLDEWETRRQLSAAKRWSNYLRTIVSRHICDAPVVILIDEIEAVRLAKFPMDDFFLSMRALFEERSSDPVCKRLTFCLMGAALPSELIADQQVTPFNVTHGIRLDDFSRAELEPLAEGLAHLGGDASAILDEVHAWTDGHPYMTMRTCAAVAHLAAIAPGDEARAVGACVEKEFLEFPLNDSNLGYAARRFDDPEYTNPNVTVSDKVMLLGRLIRGERVRAAFEDRVQEELRIAGMIKDVEEADGRWLRMRNRIFARVFDREWLAGQGNREFLTQAVWSWLESGRANGFLLRDEALARAIELARTLPLSRDEQELLDTSQRQEQERLALEQEQLEKHQAELTRQEEKLRQAVIVQRRRLLRTMAIGLVLLVFAGSFAGTVLMVRIREQKDALERVQKEHEAREQAYASMHRELDEDFRSREKELKDRYEKVKAQLNTLEAAKTTLASDLAAKQAELQTLEKNIEKRRNEFHKTLQFVESELGNVQAALNDAVKQRGKMGVELRSVVRDMNTQLTNLAVPNPSNDLKITNSLSTLPTVQKLRSDIETAKGALVNCYTSTQSIAAGAATTNSVDAGSPSVSCSTAKLDGAVDQLEARAEAAQADAVALRTALTQAETDIGARRSALEDLKKRLELVEQKTTMEPELSKAYRETGKQLDAADTTARALATCLQEMQQRRRLTLVTLLLGRCSTP